MEEKLCALLVQDYRVGKWKMSRTYLKSFWPQTSPFSSIGRDLLYHIQWWPWPWTWPLPWPTWRWTHWMAAQGWLWPCWSTPPRWTPGREKAGLEAAKNWRPTAHRTGSSSLTNVSLTGSWFLETWRRSHGFGAAPLYRAQMGKGLAQERQPEIGKMSF